EEIALIGVPGHDHRRVPQPRQYHLDLPVGAVLRLVDHDKGVVQGAAAHKPDRSDLDRSLAHQLLDAPAAEPLVQSVAERAQIGCQLLAYVTWQIAQSLPRFDGRTRQHDAADFPGLERRYRGADGEIGLAGSRRAQPNRQM